MKLKLNPKISYKTGALVLSAILLLLFCLQMENKAKLQSLQRVFMQQNEAIQQMESFEKEHPAYLSEKTRLDEMENQAEKFLPKEKTTGEFLQQVRQAAESSGVELLKWQPLEGIRAEQIYEWPIQMEAEGSYFSLRTFLQQIQTLPRFVRIRQMEMKVTKSKVHCTLMVSVYSKV